MMSVAQRLSHVGAITIREIFPDGNGRRIVPPVGCAPVEAPPQPKNDPRWNVSPHPPPSLSFADWLRASGVSYDDPYLDDLRRVWLRGEPPRQPRSKCVTPMHRKRERIPTKACPSPRAVSVAGLDLVAEARRLLKIEALLGLPMPDIRVMRVNAFRRKYGDANIKAEIGAIRIVDYPGVVKKNVQQTLAHELSHLKAGLHEGHSPVWRRKFSDVLHQGYNVRISPNEIRAKGTAGRYFAEECAL